MGLGSAHVGKGGAARSWNSFLVFNPLRLLVGVFLRGFLCPDSLILSPGGALKSRLFCTGSDPGRTPVANAIAPCQSKGEANRQPLLSSAEAEGGGQVERNHHHARNYDGGAR